ncbi:ESTA [Symbiodinium sp. CCMP2592]|nr:ESTA [Symbiodinium sp. CCMP2592]
MALCLRWTLLTLCAAPVALGKELRSKDGLFDTLTYLAHAFKEIVPGMDSQTQTISFKDQQNHDREARIFVPSNLQGRKAPLVISFHAWGANNRLQQAMDQHDAQAQQKGYMVVYPQGYASARAGVIAGVSIPGGATFNAGGCCPRACETYGMDLPGCSWTDTCYRPEVDDVGFTRELVKYSDQNINGVDFSRIYATGMSNGGFMSHRLACEASDMLAAIAPVSGVISSQDDANTKLPKPWWSQKYRCQPARKVPVLHFHGQNDMLVSYDGGLKGFGFGYFNPVKDTIAKWLEINGAAESFESMPMSYQNQQTTCWTSSGVNVTLCKVDDMSHSWPGIPQVGGSGIKATETSWEFFEQHRCEDCRP